MNNREIKFRQPIFNRDGTFKDFLYWGIGLVVDGANMNCGFGTYVKGITDPKDSQQFTGLKDKNNKDIYEGDLLKTDSGAIMQVVYREDMAQFVCRFKTGASVNIETTWEVIGDIYTTPELLKN